jgi:hypothetical protein
MINEKGKKIMKILDLIQKLLDAAAASDNGLLSEVIFEDNCKKGFLAENILSICEIHTAPNSVIIYINCNHADWVGALHLEMQMTKRISEELYLLRESRKSEK